MKLNWLLVLLHSHRCSIWFVGRSGVHGYPEKLQLPCFPCINSRESGIWNTCEINLKWEFRSSWGNSAAVRSLLTAAVTQLTPVEQKPFGLSSTVKHWFMAWHWQPLWPLYMPFIPWRNKGGGSVTPCWRLDERPKQTFPRQNKTFHS